MVGFMAARVISHILLHFYPTRIGWWEHFNRKARSIWWSKPMGFRWRFSQENQSIELLLLGDLHIPIISTSGSPYRAILMFPGSRTGKAPRAWPWAKLPVSLLAGWAPKWTTRRPSAAAKRLRDVWRSWAMVFPVGILWRIYPLVI